jgi:nucleoid-associated protein YgaU
MPIMRQDVKLGFAIGGVLLAVLTVYVLTSGPSGKPAAPDAKRGSSANASSAKRPAARPEAPAALAPAAEHPAVSPSPATAPAQATASAEKRGGELDWARLLSGEQPMPLMTQTPAPAPARGPADQPEPSDSSAPIASVPSVSMPAAVQPGPNGTTPQAPAAPDSVYAITGVAPPSTQPAPSAAARTHQIQRGETLSSISAAAYGSPNYYPHILRANPKIDPNRLRPGMIITLPDVSDVRPHDLPGGPVSEAHASPAGGSTTTASNAYRVQPGDSLYKISIKLYGRSDLAEKIYELNKETIGPDQARLRIGQVLKLPEPPTVATAR